VGKVVHYNPERFGWIEVQDKDFDHANIMFFPHDVAKAKLGNLRVGAQLKFTPRLEGQLTYACDLKVASSH
jgi:hypothetical protein